MDLSKFRALDSKAKTIRKSLSLCPLKSYQTFLKIKNKDTVVREVEVTEEMLRNATVITPQIIKEPKFTLPEINQ